jgi:hypothetical protein
MVPSVTPWDGQPLADGLLALAPGGDGGVPQEHCDWLVATVDAQPWLLPEGRVAEFLACHSGRVLVCRDAPSVYWALVSQLHANASPAAIGQLRRAIKDGRFVDLDIWQRLLDLAEDGYGKRTTPPDPTCAAGISGLVSKAAEFEGATRRMLGMPPRSLFPNSTNWLGLNNVVKAAVALLMRPSLQFPLSPAERADALEDLERRRSDLTEQVKSHPNLLRCYELADGSIKFHKDLSQYESRRLRAWLHERWNGLREPHDYLSPAPQRDSKISIRPEDWGRLADCDEQLALWAQLEKTCHAMKSLRSLTGETLAIDYELVPRLKTNWPGIGLLASLGRLRPTPGKSLVRIRFPDLESRCLAAMCRTRYGESRLADAAGEPGNLNRHVADALASCAAVDGPWTDGRSASDPVGPAAAAALLFAAGLNLGDRAAQGLIKRASGSVLDLGVIRETRQRLISLFPELEALECETAAVFHRRFAYGPVITEQRRHITQQIHLAVEPSESLSIRRSRLMKTMALHHMDHDKSRELLGKLQSKRSSESLAEDLLADQRWTTSGRLRGRCRLTEATAEFLDLTDDVLKGVLYELGVEKGLRVGMIGGTLVVEAADESSLLHAELESRIQIVGNHILSMPLAFEMYVVTH